MWLSRWSSWGCAAVAHRRTSGRHAWRGGSTGAAAAIAIAATLAAHPAATETAGSGSTTFDAPTAATGEPKLEGTWSYVTAACGGVLPVHEIARGLLGAPSPIRGELRIDLRLSRFVAEERNGDMCGTDVAEHVLPTLRCGERSFVTTGRFRLKSSPEAAVQGIGREAMRIVDSGGLSAESWVTSEQLTDHSRQGFGTSWIEHKYRLLAVKAGSSVERVLELVTLPGEVFTDPCAAADLGRFTVYLRKVPIV